MQVVGSYEHRIGLVVGMPLPCVKLFIATHESLDCHVSRFHIAGNMRFPRIPPLQKLAEGYPAARQRGTRNPPVSSLPRGKGVQMSRREIGSSLDMKLNLNLKLPHFR
jgi:hypothetical protein